jgi:hypothetical protein
MSDNGSPADVKSPARGSSDNWRTEEDLQKERERDELVNDSKAAFARINFKRSRPDETDEEWLKWNLENIKIYIEALENDRRHIEAEWTPRRGF